MLSVNVLSVGVAFKVLYVAMKRRCLTEQGSVQSKGLVLGSAKANRREP